MTFQDVYDYSKIKAVACQYKDVFFRSQLEATWAKFFDSSVHEWEYEPKQAPFRGWLPDFAIWLTPKCKEPYYCEVKPLHLMQVPSLVADKIVDSECGDSDHVVAILGIKAPLLCSNKPSLGWISGHKKNNLRCWYPFTVNDETVAEVRWKQAHSVINSRVHTTREVLANIGKDQEWGDLTDAHRWNPKYFGDVPRQIEPNGQTSVFFDTSHEPPEPEDYKTLAEFERAWRHWEESA